MAIKFNDEIFACAVELRGLRPDSKATMAARDVLVDGASIATVVSRYGISESAIYASKAKIEKIIALAKNCADIMAELKENS